MKKNDKSAATNAVQFTAMDAKRADKLGMRWSYEELLPDGTFDTNYSGTMVWNT